MRARDTHATKRALPHVGSVSTNPHLDTAPTISKTSCPFCLLLWCNGQRRLFDILSPTVTLLLVSLPGQSPSHGRDSPTPRASYPTSRLVDLAPRAHDPIHIIPTKENSNSNRFRKYTAMLDVTDFIAERGGDPEKIRESQRRRHAPVEIVDEIIALFEDHRKGRLPNHYHPR